MTSDYQPPRNALSELLTATPQNFQSALRSELKKIEADDDATWPEVPYHYGMGRIMAYESWLAKLDEQDRKAEIKACRTRYTAHYQQVADVLVERMKEQGLDLAPFIELDFKREKAHKQSAMERIFNFRASDEARATPERGGNDYGRERERTYER